MITTIKGLTGKDISWVCFGSRLKQIREAKNLDLLQASQELDLSEDQMQRLERGKYSERKSVNIVFKVCQSWDLSFNWLLNGQGSPHAEDPIDLTPATLIVPKGAGIRRSNIRVEAENGDFSDDIMEFVFAVDKYQIENEIPFPSKTQIFEIILALGYRKSGPARIAPLGYIVKKQLSSEQMNHINEKDPWHSDPNKKLRKSWRQAKRLQNPGKKYLFIDPEGRKYRLDSAIQSIPGFCKRHNIASSHMYSCAKGTKLQHKGWKARLIT